jgi:hypothetical protein
MVRPWIVFSFRIGQNPFPMALATFVAGRSGHANGQGIIKAIPCSSTTYMAFAFL